MDHATIDPDQLIEDATSSTGLDDFGDPGALVALARLVEDLNGVAQLSAGGEQVTRKQLHRILVSRLELVEQLEQRPEVLVRPVGAPIVIAGLPRTGTTFLHHLMALDPQFEFISFWQARRPYAPTVGDDPELDRRREEGEQALASLLERCPALLQIHPMGAALPDECVVAMQLSFVSLQFELLYRVPGYSAWVTPEARVAAYRELVTILQLLQRPEGGGRWLLKSPGHTPAASALLTVLPDVHVVQIHREPVTVMASFLSLAHSVRRLYSDDVDPADLGREWLGRWAAATEQFGAVRDSMAAERISDVRYADLVKDPIATVHALYDQCGLELTADAETAMRAMVDGCRANPLEHRYALNDYSLTEKDVTAAFAPYLHRFGSLVG